jgi:hypothetical protein
MFGGGGMMTGPGGSGSGLGDALGFAGGMIGGKAGAALGIGGALLGIFNQLTGGQNGRPIERRADLTDEIERDAVESRRQKRQTGQRQAAADTESNREQMAMNQQQGSYTESDRHPTAGTDSIYGSIEFPDIGKLASAMYDAGLSTPMQTRVI